MDAPKADEGLIQIDANHSACEPLARVNLGCGTTPTSGWLNFDNSSICKLGSWPILLRMLTPYLGIERRQFLNLIQRREIRYADVVNRIPLPDRSVAVVYTSHMLDQLSLNKLPKFFNEVLRVLVPGGCLRVAVTDLRILAEGYIAGTWDANQFVEGSLLAATARDTILIRLKHLILGPRGYRRWIYDGPALVKLLRRFGFADPVILPPGHTSVPDPGALRIDERAEESVYVEARKPAG